MNNSPVREIRTVLNDSGDPGYVNRILIGTPTTGNVRIEFVTARYGQIIPCNWSMVQYMHFMSSYIPLRYQVADAQNLIVKAAVEGDFEWVGLIEHDTVIPPDTFIRWNEYMRRGDTPVVSGLYFTRSNPSEPLVYRGRGNGYYGDWKLGDLVWCDGVPTGCLLIHCALLRAMWAESEEYEIAGQKTRRVFDTPRRAWFDEKTGQFNTTSGTSDLEWCSRIMREGFLKKAGWGAFAEEHPRHPFLIDTNLFCYHCNPDGAMFPDKETLARFKRS